MDLPINVEFLIFLFILCVLGYLAYEISWMNIIRLVTKMAISSFYLIIVIAVELPSFIPRFQEEGIDMFSNLGMSGILKMFTIFLAIIQLLDTFKDIPEEIKKAQSNKRTSP